MSGDTLTLSQKGGKSSGRNREKNDARERVGGEGSRATEKNYPGGYEGGGQSTEQTQGEKKEKKVQCL